VDIELEDIVFSDLCKDVDIELEDIVFPDLLW
jgi:hypothetical protein